MAVDVITRHFVDVFMRALDTAITPTLEINAVYDAVQHANRAIYEMALTRPECAGMGSTVVILVIYENKMCVGHVGDSRLYRFRDTALTQLTEDHSVIQELVSRGLLTLEEARHTVGKNLVTRALGVEANVAPDVTEQPLEESDLFLMCSDGLNDMLTDDVIRSILAEHRNDLDAAAKRLIAAANEHGGADNVSVVLARPDGKMFKRSAKIIQQLHQQANQQNR